ncbi:amino acid kinase family protein [[Eubacterium] cellulosolvens]
MDRITIVKIGGSLVDFEGKNIAQILAQIKEIHQRDGRGPLLVVSAPKGVTDHLQEMGEQAARSKKTELSFLFEKYQKLAKGIIHPPLLSKFLRELEVYQSEVEDALDMVNKRFEGNNKAVVLTSGGELPTSALFDYFLQSNELKSKHMNKEHWNIITDDYYDDAEPDYEASKERMRWLLKAVNEKKIVCQAGFLGQTLDGLETLLGRGGSDLTAVFDAALLKDYYTVRPLLYKKGPVQSADPSIVKNQKLKPLKTLTYNEAIKASSTGMKIVQNSAVRCAREFHLPIEIAPLSNPSLNTEIKDQDPGGDVVKCITGAKGCTIITIDNDRSKSLEDCIRLWEGFDNFLDLGTEVLESGKVIRDYLVLEDRFVKQHEEQIRGFDSGLEIEYGIGVVTLIGDKMRNSAGIASIAIGSIPHINIKRGVFAPHTSQIILALKEDDVNEAVATIHKSLARALPF